MLRHVVMFKWSEDVDDAHIAATAEALDGLVKAIPEIRTYRHGPDAVLSEGNFDYVVVGDFDSAEDYVTYRDCKAHTDMVRDFVAGRIETRAAVQYELGD